MCCLFLTCFLLENLTNSPVCIFRAFIRYTFTSIALMRGHNFRASFPVKSWKFFFFFFWNTKKPHILTYYIQISHSTHTGSLSVNQTGHCLWCVINGLSAKWASRLLYWRVVNHFFLLLVLSLPFLFKPAALSYAPPTFCTDLISQRFCSRCTHHQGRVKT